MIQIISKCELLNSELKEFVRKGLVKDYRVYLRTNEEVFVYLKGVAQKSEDSVEGKLQTIYKDTLVEFVENEDDDFYNTVFSKQNKIVYENGRRRLNSLLNETTRKQSKIPIVSFYSYKGGMGRTTTLASFAMYLTLRHRKKVFIIDCDLEAPGFNNFFLKYPAEHNQQQGLIEYLIDKETGFASKEKLNLYTSEISHEYSGEGIIRVMYAGNLATTPINDNSSNTHIAHYVEGLARLDLSNATYSANLFEGLFEDIKEAYSPDVILIDSKTGISDVMGLTVCTLSNLVVGFFRNDSQSWPGLYYFTKTMVGRTSVEPFIVNSILPSYPSTSRALFTSFKDKVSSITEQIIGEEESVDFPCFAISRNEVLEVVGTSAENVEDLPNLVQNDDYKLYKELFEAINERLNSFQNNSVEKILINSKPEEVNIEAYKAYTKDQINKLTPTDKAKKLNQSKQYILSKAYDSINSIDLYADNVSIPDEINNDKFFFRDCMNDLFNQDKYLILGSKGTGKSYLYKTLRSKEGVSYLKTKTKREGNFVFLYTIDKDSKIFSVSKLSNNYTALQRYRFWMIYTWNSIFEDLTKYLPSYRNDADVKLTFQIKDDENTTNKIDKAIENEKYVISIEKEFDKLDNYLSKINYSVSIVYDQLDEIVRPTDWNDWIPELLNIWRVKRFSNISGKVFLRTDLFRGLVGLTNKNDIENKAINVEWSKEEIYSYFFKMIMSKNVQEACWEYMNLSGKEDIIVSQCRQNYRKNNNQFKLDDYILRQMVQTFFGEYVDVNNSTRMGTSYDWFYKNLKNADDTISIRPFIDLLKMAMEMQKEKKYQSEETSTPILYQKYYTDKDVRLKAVKRHYEDLVSNTVGNKPIDYIFDFISNTPERRFKLISIRKYNFEALLSNVITEYGDKEEMKDITIDALKALLIDNGIVKKVNYGRGDEYVFSFLYKYRLGLKKSF